jgi:hypothetical protein
MTPNHLDRWTGRIEALRVLQNRFATAARYGRASRAQLALIRAYDRWAQEVFSLPTPG